MKFPFVYGAILAATCGSLCVVACGSDASDSGSTAGDAGESSSKAGAEAVGGNSGSGGAPGDSAGDTSGGAVDGGAAGQTSAGGSSTGGAGSSGAGAGGTARGGSSGSAGSGGKSSAGGGGSTAPVKDGWRCAQVGEACTCVEVTTDPSNTCTVPMTDCCFSFVINGKQNCQCEPTTYVACASWMASASGSTKVDSCPP